MIPGSGMHATRVDDASVTERGPHGGHIPAGRFGVVGDHSGNSFRGAGRERRAGPAAGAIRRVALALIPVLTLAFTRAADGPSVIVWCCHASFSRPAGSHATAGVAWARRARASASPLGRVLTGAVGASAGAGPRSTCAPNLRSRAPAVRAGPEFLDQHVGGGDLRSICSPSSDLIRSFVAGALAVWRRLVTTQRGCRAHALIGFAVPGAPTGSSRDSCVGCM